MMHDGCCVVSDAVVMEYRVQAVLLPVMLCMPRALVVTGMRPSGPRGGVLLSPCSLMLSACGAPRFLWYWALYVCESNEHVMLRSGSATRR